jgi:hypothetical protein
MSVCTRSRSFIPLTSTIHKQTIKTHAFIIYPLRENHYNHISITRGNDVTISATFSSSSNKQTDRQMLKDARFRKVLLT